MSDCAIAIFVKTPGLSPVKSRLARSIGEKLAIDCHLRCAHAVAAVARQAGIGPVYWALAEDHPRALETWQGLPTICQRGADLGMRMQGVHDELIGRHGRSLLLGADLPQIEAGPLREAAARLSIGEPVGVIGPARDGGFWLVGANTRLPAEVWLAPAYGKDRVLQDFLAADTTARRWHELRQHSDLDTLEDLPLVLAELRALECPHPLQQQLLDWLTGLAARPCQPESTQES